MEVDGMVVVTGAGGALGQALVTAYREAGAEVIAVTRAPVPAPHPGVRYERADLTSEGEVAALFERVGAPFAVANTVGGYAPARPLTDLDAGELTTQLTLNLTTAALVTSHALRAMAPSGRGRIIHTASRAATHPAGAGFAYSVAKAGVVHLVRMAAEEVAGTGIRVNAVSPAIIDTQTNRRAMPGADHDAWPAPSKIAEVFLYLTSARAELINGAVVPV